MCACALSLASVSIMCVCACALSLASVSIMCVCACALPLSKYCVCVCVCVCSLSLASVNIVCVEQALERAGLGFPHISSSAHTACVRLV